MTQYKESRWTRSKELKKKNRARQGSLLDFIEDFVDRFPGCVDEYESL